MVRVARVERAVARHGEEFLEEFLLPAEIGACFRSRRPLSSCASLFAAKEALFKALGTGRSGGLRWLDVEVRCDGRARPRLRLSGETGRVAAGRGVRRVHCDLTCARSGAGSGVAAAMVVLEG